MPAGAEALPPSTPDRTAFQANGDVYAVARGGGLTYIGGDFNALSAPTGPAAKLSATNGNRFASFPTVTGGNSQVLASAPDGSGGYFIGGDFTAVGGEPRNNIAHVLADGTVDPNFNPDSGGRVNALVRSGSALYVGGFFHNIGGLARQNVAKLSAVSGNAFSGFHPSPNSQVHAIAVSSDGVYIGGEFSRVNLEPGGAVGQDHRGIARLSLATGNPFSTFTDDASPGARVFALAAMPSGIYVGGRFSRIGGQDRDNLARLSPTSGNAFSAFNPSLDYPPDPTQEAVRALAVDGGSLYVGGLFDTVAGQNHRNLAKLSATTGNGVDTWDPDPDQQVQALTLSGSTLFASGTFSNIGGLQRPLLAKLSLASGNAFTTFNPRPVGGFGATVAVSGSTVLAGGSYEAMNRVERNHIAALDSNGIPTSWNPNATGRVNAIVVDGGSVYVGGGFSSFDDVEPSIGGQPRDYIAKLSAASGNAFSGFNPGADNNVLALALSGDDLYAGGDFIQIGGVGRNRIAKLTTAGAVDGGFNPGADAAVMALAPTADGTSVFAAGFFQNIGDEAERGISKLDAATGLGDLAFDANSTDNVRVVVPAGPTVYVGGDFHDGGAGNISIGGRSRNYLARLSATSGDAFASFPANGDGNIESLALGGSVLYAGGGFTSIGAQLPVGLPRNGLAALSATSGDAFSAFNPNLDNAPQALSVDGSTLYAGGRFVSVGGLPRRGYAQFTEP